MVKGSIEDPIRTSSWCVGSVYTEAVHCWGSPWGELDHGICSFKLSPVCLLFIIGFFLSVFFYNY